MWKRNLSALTCLGLLVVFGGCPVDNAGGLREEDFERTCLLGFGEENDSNDYAWSMEHFVPDGKHAGGGYVYVGTGNSLIDTVLYMIRGRLFGTQGDPPNRPPEIRRYRSDLNPPVWERVFDQRDVDDGPPYTSLGFRHMTTYRAANGTKYLYAASMSEDSGLWRSTTGDPGTWESAGDLGKRGSVRWMQEHDGILYLAFALDVTQEGAVAVGELWATDGDTFWQVVDDGFGNPNNEAIASLVSFNGWLYAGTLNAVDGYEIWKLAGPDKLAAPVKVVDQGGPHRDNEWAMTPYVFNGKLYYGSSVYVTRQLPSVAGTKGCDIIRISPDDTWETVVGHNSLSGYGPGFDRLANVYCWWMEEHDGWLYASTWDFTSSLFYFMERLPEMVSWLFDKSDNEAITKQLIGGGAMLGGGADLYKTRDGVNWYPVSLDGFGNPYNYGFRTMVSAGDSLCVGTANPRDGMSVWEGTAPVAP